MKGFHESISVGYHTQQRRVIRPSDGGQVYIYYDNQFTTLESLDSELWIDDNQVQRILTLDQILRYIGVSYIKL